MPKPDDKGSSSECQMPVYGHEVLRNITRSIQARASRIAELYARKSPLSLRPKENRDRLEPLRYGAVVAGAASMDRADELAAALHAEFPLDVRSNNGRMECAAPFGGFWRRGLSSSANAAGRTIRDREVKLGQASGRPAGGGKGRCWMPLARAHHSRLPGFRRVGAAA